jgi:hypothetical protein
MRRCRLVSMGLAAFVLIIGSRRIAGAQKNTVPFETLGHLIIVKGNVNGSEDDYNFVVDTGALTFIDKGIAGALGLKQKGMMAKVNTLDLSGYRIENIFCFTTFDFHHFDALGTPLHGIIGSNLLERFTVTIDFKACEITFSSDTTSLAHSADGLFLKFRNHPVNNAPIVRCTIGDRNVEGMIDTGQPNPVVLPLESFDEYKDTALKDYIRSRGLMEEWPGTTVDHNYLARLKAFAIEDLELTNVICLFGQIPELLSMPLIGNDFLSQFKLILHYPGDELLMIPYDDMAFDANRYSIGLNPDLSDEGDVIVKGIWERSPADRAGLDTGDVILSFNAREATPNNLMDLIYILVDEKTESVILDVMSRDRRRTVTLHKAMLF